MAMGARVIALSFPGLAPIVIAVVVLWAVSLLLHAEKSEKSEPRVEHSNVRMVERPPYDSERE